MKAEGSRSKKKIFHSFFFFFFFFFYFFLEGGEGCRGAKKKNSFIYYFPPHLCFDAYIYIGTECGYGYSCVGETWGFPIFFAFYLTTK